MFCNLKSDASGDFGAYADWTFLRPKVADDMAKTTYVEMQNFLKSKGQEPQNNWNAILDNVQKFNRAVIINDPGKKGEKLYE